MRKLTISSFFLCLFLVIFMSPLKILAETFQWPSSGYIAWIFKSNNGNHNGIDIWTNKEGGWIDSNLKTSNAVYPVVNGTVLYVFTNDPKGGYRIKHSNSLYTNYWHVKDRKVAANTSVNSSTLLGFQDNDVTVHLHLTVSATDSDIGIDPSSYFGMQLNSTLPNPVGYLSTEVKANSCGGTSPILINWNQTTPINCSAVSSITILPESTLITNTGEIVLMAT